MALLGLGTIGDCRYLGGRQPAPGAPLITSPLGQAKNARQCRQSARPSARALSPGGGSGSRVRGDFDRFLGDDDAPDAGCTRRTHDERDVQRRAELAEGVQGDRARAALDARDGRTGGAKRNAELVLGDALVGAAEDDGAGDDSKRRELLPALSRRRRPRRELGALGPTRGASLHVALQEASQDLADAQAILGRKTNHIVVQALRHPGRKARCVASCRLDVQGGPAAAWRPRRQVEPCLRLGGHPVEVLITDDPAAPGPCCHRITSSYNSR